MKGDYALKILERISEVAVGSGDLFEAFLTSGYGGSHDKIAYNLRRFKQRRGKEYSVNLEYIRLQRRYHNILSWLKRDGLIEEKRKNGKKVFELTRKGLQKILSLRARRTTSLPMKLYEAEAVKNFVIVVFDIPERDRRKRDWLRGVLKNLKFKMLQKSVWIGRVKIPKDFIYDLSKLRLTEFVEIFEITKTGSLRNVV